MTDYTRELVNDIDNHEQLAIIHYGAKSGICGTQCGVGGVLYIDRITMPQGCNCIHLHGTKYVGGTATKTGFLMALMVEIVPDIYGSGQ